MQGRNQREKGAKCPGRRITGCA